MTKENKVKNKTITKKILINTISLKEKLPSMEVRQVIQSLLDTLHEHLSVGDRIEFRDFGIFEVVLRKQKVGRNPKDPSHPIIIPDHYAVKFTPSKKMREQVEAG